MPLTGGEADKIGNGYKALWTVCCLLRILAGEARSIYLEPFGNEGEGAEFVFTRNDGVREFHQVKRQRGGGWNIAALGSARVLYNFKARLIDSPSAQCVFVSQDEPSDLRELWERASRSPDAAQFELHYLNTDEHKSNFALLQKHWGNCSLNEAFDLIRRISIEGGAETTLREEAVYRAGTLVIGETENVVTSLWKLALESIRQTLDATAIWSYLEDPKRGFSRRNWNSDKNLLHLIATALSTGQKSECLL